MKLFGFLKKKKQPSSSISGRKHIVATVPTWEPYDAINNTVASHSSFRPNNQENQKPTAPYIQPDLTYVEKETVLVRHISTKDMLQFPLLPYNLNFPIRKFILPHAHPFAYIDLDPNNQEIAKKDMGQINQHILQAQEYIALLTKDISIQIDKIAFTEYDPGYGYTRLMCTPYTVDGKVSKVPLSLSFMTRLDISSYTAHGDLHYDVNGKIQKAEVYIWKKHSGWLFYFTTIDGVLLLQKAESTLKPDIYGRPGVIYRDKSLIEAEAKREQETRDFKWLQENLPDKCPASISGFRRMKNQNTKNYQALQQLAAEMGKKI